jgi:predicted 2-oxoglutarate/Fe(II)-dependent dioxygenase YbiX
MHDMHMNGAAAQLPEDRRDIHEVRFFDPAECEQVLRELEGAGVKAGGESIVFDGSVVNRDMAVMGGELSAPLLDAMRLKLLEKLRPLTHPKGVEVFRVSPVRLLSYGMGGVVEVHRDALADFARWRRYTVLAYLNDDFEGGETQFPLHDLNVCPAAGKGVIFPSYFLHQVLPMRSGRKFVLSAFLMDPETSRGNE